MLSSTKESYTSVEFIYCGCNCGKTRPKYSWGRIRNFIKNHDKSKLKGSDSPVWKNSKVSKRGLHLWVNRQKNKPELCEMCNKVPPYDLSNVSGNYLRDLDDWQYICRKCHMTLDNRIKNLHLSNTGRKRRIKKSSNL